MKSTAKIGEEENTWGRNEAIQNDIANIIRTSEDNFVDDLDPKNV